MPGYRPNRFQLITIDARRVDKYSHHWHIALSSDPLADLLINLTGVSQWRLRYPHITGSLLVLQSP